MKTSARNTIGWSLLASLVISVAIGSWSVLGHKQFKTANPQVFATKSAGLVQVSGSTTTEFKAGADRITSWLIALLKYIKRR